VGRRGNPLAGLASLKENDGMDDRRLSMLLESVPHGPGDFSWLMDRSIDQLA
jgi:hypothetical protein